MSFCLVLGFQTKGEKFRVYKLRIEVCVNKKSPQTSPLDCHCTHNVSALAFSSGVENLFHEFNEIIFPLFIITYSTSNLAYTETLIFRPWLVTQQPISL